MLLKVDIKTWIEIPDDSTEEFKKAKLKKYSDLRAKQAEELKEHSRIFKSGSIVNKLGALYDKRISLTEIIQNYK